MDEMTGFIKLARISDFGNKNIQSYRVLGRNVAIVNDRERGFYAVEISCKHQNADLTTGRFKGDEVRCPRHGWVYNIWTGECLNHNSSPLRRYGLKIQGDDIYVSTLPEESVAALEHDDDWMGEVVIRKKEGPPTV